MKFKCIWKGCSNTIKITFKEWLYYKLYRYGDVCDLCYKKIIADIKNDCKIKH